MSSDNYNYYYEDDGFYEDEEIGWEAESWHTFSIVHELDNANDFEEDIAAIIIQRWWKKMKQ